MIRTVDTDVVVLAVSCWFMLAESNLVKVWVSFGVGKHHRYLAIHEIANALGPIKSKAFLMFHAFTGCDTVS